jgi:hypothetical protein
VHPDGHAPGAAYPFRGQQGGNRVLTTQPLPGSPLGEPSASFDIALGYTAEEIEEDGIGSLAPAQGGRGSFDRGGFGGRGGGSFGGRGGGQP